MFSTLGGCVISWRFCFFFLNERNDHSILNIAKVYLHLNKWKGATQCIANQMCDIRAKKSTSAQFCRNSRMLFKIVYIYFIIFFLNYQEAECFSKFLMLDHCKNAFGLFIAILVAIVPPCTFG